MIYDHNRCFQFPSDVINSPNFRMLTGNAVKLLVQFCEQYNGNNNGDLSCAFSVMRRKGWASAETLFKARDCLEHYGMIVRTRYGGKNCCNLYAITWERIDDCNGKIDQRPTSYPSRTFAKKVEKWSSKN